MSGSFDVVEAADWSTLFISPTYPGVGYLPISGDNADTINGVMTHAFPFRLTPVTDAKTATGLCTNTGLSMLIVGQGSLAAQPLDLFRASVVGAGFSISAPNPWGPIEKFTLAALPLVAVNTTHDVAVDIFDCFDGGLYRLVHKVQTLPEGGKVYVDDTGSEQKQPPLHVTGHAKRLGFGSSDAGVQRRSLNDATNDLVWQVNCIVMRRFRDPDPVVQQMRQADSPVAVPMPQGGPASTPECLTYYSRLSWVPVAPDSVLWTGQELAGPMPTFTPIVDVSARVMRIRPTPPPRSSAPFPK